MSNGDTAFWGRGGEWNIPLNAIWSDPYDGAACLSWAGGTLDALAPHTTGVYSVEVRPGFPETGARSTLPTAETCGDCANCGKGTIRWGC